MMNRGLVRVYVAGPLTGTDPTPPSYIRNLRAMTDVCADIRKMGAAPYNPGADIIDGLVSGDMTLEDFQHVSSAWLRAAHIVFRMGGASRGADAEVALAKSLDIPVVTSFASLEGLIRAHATGAAAGQEGNA